MPFRLTAPFAADSAAEEGDTRAVKQALNRLGYYTPHVQDGITGIPDRAVFAALKAFQKDNGIYPDGRMRPADITARTLDALESAREASDEKYIWRSVRDEKTRPLHADLDGHVFSMNHPSEDGHPGDAPNCRCWMEKVAGENENPYPDAISPVYPEIWILSALRMGRIAIAWRLWILGGKANLKWTLGKHKSAKKWANQLGNREWTPEQITRTIERGKQYPAPNKVHPENPATRYQYEGRFVVRDDKTKEILQISGPDFTPNKIP